MIDDILITPPPTLSVHIDHARGELIVKLRWQVFVIFRLSSTEGHRFHLDYAVFAIPDFDANAYANAVLAGEAYPTSSSQPKPKPTLSIQEPAKDDISVAISKLDLGIEDVNKQIKVLVCFPSLASSCRAGVDGRIEQVTAHHEDLLQHASNASKLSGSLSSIRRGLDDVESSIEK